jgi:tetratricopeptide (TPR) repeat protein
MAFTNRYQTEDERELKLNEAIKALETSNKKDADDPITALYLGLCHKELKNYKLAVAYLKETLNRIIPDYVDEIYSNLGFSFSELSDYPESIKAFKNSLKYNPEKFNLIFYLANIYDRYYEDKSVAALYYQKFLDVNIDSDEKLIEYSKNRIEVLCKELNFWRRLPTN